VVPARTTCNAPALPWPKTNPSPHVSTLRPDKPQLPAPGLLSSGPMTTARPTSPAARAIPSFSTIIAAWSTKQQARSRWQAHQVHRRLWHWAAASGWQSLSEDRSLSTQAENRLQRLHRRLSRKQKGGKNRHLAKSIHDAGWGTFLLWVKHYGAVHGIAVIAVEAHFTSQKCSVCGTMVKKSLSVRTHICTSCGVVLDRDYNAALNILAKAQQGTLGHRETSTSAVNASGQTASTRPRHAKMGKRAG
jgi:Putative transposase DNA-binding domain